VITVSVGNSISGSTSRGNMRMDTSPNNMIPINTIMVVTGLFTDVFDMVICLRFEV